AGAQEDPRGRWRQRAGMPAHPAPRGRPRRPAFLRAPPPPTLAAAFRALLDPLSDVLPAGPGEPELRAASPPLVCAKPPGRGLRRDLRRVAEPALQLAQALCRLAGAQEAALRRRTDGRDRRREAEAHAPLSGRSTEPAEPHAGGILPAQAGDLSRPPAADL